MNGDLRLPEQAGPPDDDATAALLRGVLQRQAGAVEPGDGWARIQAELAHRPAPRRSFLPPTLGPVMAAAAALVVVASAGTVAVLWGQREQPATTAGSVTLRPLDANDALHTPSAALPVYVAARQNGRVVLYREFRRLATRGDAAAKVEAAVGLALTTKPQDADYEQLFAPDPRPAVSATVTADVVTLDISPAPRPARPGVTRDEATAAVQQLVWTATAAAAVAVPGGAAPARPTRAVRILLDGWPAQSLFGLVPLDRAIDRTFEGDPRARAWVIEPAEDGVVAAGPLSASGDAAAGADGAVRVTLTRGGRVVAEQEVPLAPLEGGPGPVRAGQRGAWRVSGWATPTPGRYELTVTVVDADGTRWTDTKRFTVR